MNATELDQLTERVFVTFPMILKQLKENSPNLRGTLEVWQKVLANVTLAEANAVVDSWLDGRREPLKVYECDLVALTIRSAADFDRSKLRAVRNSEQLQRRGIRRNNDAGFGAVLVAAWDLREQFVRGEIDEKELEAEVHKAASQIPTPNHIKPLTYTCLLCLDSGLVRVYSEECIRRMKEDPIWDGALSDNHVTACNCAKGTSIVDSPGQKRTIARYSFSRFCKVTKVSKSEQREEVLAWIESLKRSQWKP